MGVIYKTKEEVREFILQEKKARPEISCRQLVPLIKEKFGVPLSKSTINSIFKEADLSGPVGRKPSRKAKTAPERKAEKTEKETVNIQPALPRQETPSLIEEKKGPVIIPPPPQPVTSEPILLGENRPTAPPSDEVKPAEPEPPAPLPVEPPIEEKPPVEPPAKEPAIEPEIPVPEAAAPAPPQPEPAEQKIPEKVEEAAKAPEISPPTIEKPPPAPPAPAPVEKTEEKAAPTAKEEVETVRPFEVGAEEIVDGLGCFFLKAAEWELSHESLLGGLLKKYIPHTPAEELTLNSEILLFLEAFGLGNWKSFEQYNQKGLWAVNSAQAKVSPQYLLNFAKDLKKLRGLPMGVFNEYFQNSTEILYQKVFLEDRTIIYIDPQFHSLWQDINVPDTIFTTAYKARGYLKQFFEENSQPIILQTAPGYNTFSRILSEFIWSCEALPGKSMARIALYNHKRQEVHTTDILPVEKRYFIIGFWPWQEEGARFIREDIRRVKSFFLPEQNQEVFFSDNLAYFKQPSSHQKSTIRTGLIRDTALGWPVLGVLSNLPEEKPMEEIIAMYLRRWPNAEEGYRYFTKKCGGPGHRPFTVPTPTTILGESGGLLEYTLTISSSDLHANLNALIFALNNFCRQYFFPPALEKADFTLMREKFYNLPGTIRRQKDFWSITLHPPANYPSGKDLSFAVCRFNESDIKAPSGEQLFMQID